MNRVTPGEPYPLGACPTTQGVNFALFSEDAERVQLCLFDTRGREHAIEMAQRTGDTWHIHVAGIGVGQRYGYRVHGRWAPSEGYRFNPAKLLLDPYARALNKSPTTYATCFDYREVDGEMKRDKRNNASAVAKSVVVAAELPPRSLATGVPLADTLLYELHVRGFTRLHPDLPAIDQGTFAGLGHPRIIDYLKSLGVTTLELMPVQEFMDEVFVREKGLSNYWGYNPLGFFMPTSRYATYDAGREFRLMIDTLHEAGIEVVLDVVYNHTAEGGATGPTFNFRGIDNRAYYRLVAGDPASYVNDSGCGNSLNIAHPAVMQMVMDSLRFWRSEMGVDGFRFDLATSLGRSDTGFSNQAPLFQAIRQDPVVGRTKLIAEPWDLGIDGYRLGQFPRGWSEWNDQYRDTIRRFWRGDAGVLPEFARLVHGASDVFEGAGRAPQAGINFVTSHDGFTLADLVSYEHKHNEANLELNNDGHNGSISCNHGVEGATDDPAIVRLRDKQVRNMLGTLLLSHGIPMMLAGDELGRSQLGNNNAYCQDNEISWLNWRALENPRIERLLNYTRRLVQIRRSWDELRTERFIHGNPHYEDKLNEIAWYHPRGTPMTSEDWQHQELATLGLMLHGAAIFPDRASGTRLILAIFNSAAAPVPFVAPTVPLAGYWHCQVSSAHDLDQAIVDTPPGDTLLLEEKSLGLFEFRSQMGEETGA